MYKIKLILFQHKRDRLKTMFVVKNNLEWCPYIHISSKILEVPMILNKHINLIVLLSCRRCFVNYSLLLISFHVIH